MPLSAHRASTAERRNTRFLFLLLHQLIDGSRREKVFYVVGVPGSNGVPNVEPEARLVLGEGVRFLPGKPETLENAFYLELELELERFVVIRAAPPRRQRRAPCTPDGAGGAGRGGGRDARRTAAVCTPQAVFAYVGGV